MQSSSDSLLHFTKSLEVIIAILNDKFYGSYCLENFQYEDLTYELAVPKISFCDIPEGTITSYTHYGKYCIGLSKDWGKKNSLNPVLYIEKHSALAECFIKGYKGTNIGVNIVNEVILGLGIVFDNTKGHESMEVQQKEEMYDKIETGLNEVEKLGKVVTFAQYMPYYVKHYEDDLIRRDETFKNYRFYDEREWCFVPKELQTSNELYKSAAQYKAWREQNREKQLLNKVSLDFDYEDITHLIVEKQDDIELLSLAIDNLPTGKLSETTKERLKSIITINSNLDQDTLDKKTKNQAIS